MAKLTSPGHVSVGGKLYERDEKTGTVEVPDEHVPHLIEAHGCQHAPKAPGRPELTKAEPTKAEKTEGKSKAD